MQQKEIHRIMENLDRVFSGAAWHGKSVMEVLEEIPPEVAFKPSVQIHRICELVQHMTGWRRFAVKKLQGDTDYEVSADDNWRCFEKEGSKTWSAILEDLKTSQTDLLEALKNTADDRLDDPVDTKAYSFYTLLHGVTQHDLYHLGEIALLSRILQTH
jgi:hypothetical protein